MELIVGQWQRSERPVLGIVHRAAFTAVRTRLVTSDERAVSGAVRLRDHDSCDSLASSLIARRKTAPSVSLVLAPIMTP